MNTLTLTKGQLSKMTMELWLYDDVQHGWEQNPNGFEANAKHTLFHLTKNLVKDFADEQTLAEEIAPDSAMYALRLTRWNAIQPFVLATELSIEDTHVSVAETVAQRFSGIPLHQASYIAATSAVARHVHGYDHRDEYEETVAAQPELAKEAGGLLLYSAQLQAQQVGFDLEEAVYGRLSALRELFGIPPAGQALADLQKPPFHQ